MAGFEVTLHGRFCRDPQGPESTASGARTLRVPLSRESPVFMQGYGVTAGKGMESRQALALGRSEGLKGGEAGASVLPHEKRSQIARKAVLVRWAKGKKT